MKKVLVISSPRPLEFEQQIHYSTSKGYQMALGFYECGCDVYLFADYSKEFIQAIKKITETKIHYICSKDTTEEFINSMDLIVFCLEAFIPKLLENYPVLNKLVFDEKNRKPILFCRMDAHSWMKDYKDLTTDTLLRQFDYVSLQNTRALKAFKMSCTPENFIQNKVFISSMGVPSIIPPPGKCPFIKHKHNLIYMGRMRQTKNRLRFLIDIMNKLDNNYHLNLLPGSFNKPDDSTRKKCNPSQPEDFKWLQEYFAECNRITVHNTVMWGDHWNYLQHSDCGIDFSASGRVIPSIGDNAKLLEYLAAGLPVVTELGPGNLSLVLQSNGGLIFNGIGEPINFVDLIQKCVNMVWDRNAISQSIISTESWRVKCQEILIITKTSQC